jgi:hypothetical protein
MGVIQCKEHGLRCILHVCSHISYAVANGVRCAGIDYRSYIDTEIEEICNSVGIEDFRWSCWCCPQCIQKYGLPPTETVVLQVDEFLADKKDLFQPVCPDCFDNWLQKGMGDTLALHKNATL